MATGLVLSLALQIVSKCEFHLVWRMGFWCFHPLQRFYIKQLIITIRKVKYVWLGMI